MSGTVFTKLQQSNVEVRPQGQSEPRIDASALEVLHFDGFRCQVAEEAACGIAHKDGAPRPHLEIMGMQARCTLAWWAAVRGQA